MHRIHQRPEHESSDVRRSLVEALRARESALIAFSGGVDSGLVAALAHQALGTRALAVTAAAETLTGRELDDARRLAREIGIAHEVVSYRELDDEEYVRNPAWRCYVCQGMRMGTMVRLARERGYAVVCDGTNASDPGPDRPGLQAVREQGVWSPLLDQGVTKDAVRTLARELGLSAWDKPANACLSSRIPHGQPVTLGKLRRIEQAEALLLDAGFRVVRVRYLESLALEGRAPGAATARVEVGEDEVSRLAASWEDWTARLRQLGFGEVTYAPRGYARGGANAVAAAGGVA